MFTPLLGNPLACRSRISYLPDLSPVITDSPVILFVFVFNFPRGRTQPLLPPPTNSILISVTGDHIKSKGNGITPSREKLFDLRFEGHFFRLLLPLSWDVREPSATQDSSDFTSRILFGHSSFKQRRFPMGFKARQ